MSPPWLKSYPYYLLQWRGTSHAEHPQGSTQYFGMLIRNRTPSGITSCSLSILVSINGFLWRMHPTTFPMHTVPYWVPHFVTLAPQCEKQGLLIVKECSAGQYVIERKASNPCYQVFIVPEALFPRQYFYSKVKNPDNNK